MHLSWSSKLYAEAGKKDQLYRIWKHYGQTRKVFNKGYMTMMGLLLKLDDVKGAEKTLRNWTSKNLPYDFGLPSSLIDAHCKNGLLEKAQPLINHAETKKGVT